MGRATVLLALAVLSACGGGRGAKVPAPPAAPAAAPRPRLKLGPQALRVCAFGFHSPYELDVFRAHLPAADFDFVDLTPVSPTEPAAAGAAPAISPLLRTTPGWLLDRCQADLRCDVVVFSGEFAGGFFGRYGAFVAIQELEEASCQARCRGLFHEPREVFLLACNTLASKSADDRTPEEYLTVLLAHGFSREEAERVVDLRYGPLGPSFRESLRRIFMGVPRIYGFSSVAPCGEITAPMLERYFRRKGDYARYLGRAGRERAPNADLLAAFEETSLVQTTGVQPGETVAADRDLVCRLYDEGESVRTRLGIVGQMLARDDFLAFLPTIEVFLDRHPPSAYDRDERRQFVQIQSLERPRRQMTELMQRLKVSSSKMQMTHVALQLGWITPAAYQQIAAEAARQLLAEPLSTEVVNIACALARTAPAGASLRSEEIPDALFWQAEGYRMLDCLAPADARVSARMLAGLDSIDESTRLWAAYALSRRRPLDEAVLTRLAAQLGDPSAGVRERVRWIYAAEAPLSPAVLAAIRARDPSLAQALNAAGADEERR